MTYYTYNRTAAARWLPTKKNVWYKYEHSSGPESWFFCTDVNKNGGLTGVKVEQPFGKGARKPAPKATKHNTGLLFEGDQRIMKETPASSIPDDVREAAKEKGAHGA